VDVLSGINVEEKAGFVEGQSRRPPGFIHIRIRQKEVKSNGTKFRKLDTVFGKSSEQMNVYDNFVKQISEAKSRRPANNDSDTQ
jgi:hypothetical protein